MPAKAFAVVAHPDDIEFQMAGTMLLLRRAGFELHYLTVANGSCGSVTMDAAQTVATRTEESRRAAQRLSATYHPPLVDDIQILYEPRLLARLAAIYRQVAPDVLLVPAPDDYMEDHVNTARLMVTAAFCRGMRNFPTDPPTAPVEGSVAVYHAMPVGLTDILRRPVEPHFCVDVSSVLVGKREALLCHRSQKEWLDRSQGLDDYVRQMEEAAAAVGRMSGRFPYAEGFRRHSHVGFGAKDFDPLCDALKDHVAFLE